MHEREVPTRERTSAGWQISAGCAPLKNGGRDGGEMKGWSEGWMDGWMDGRLLSMEQLMRTEGRRGEEMSARGSV